MFICVSIPSLSSSKVSILYTLLWITMLFFQTVNPKITLKQYKEIIFITIFFTNKQNVHYMHVSSFTQPLKNYMQCLWVVLNVSLLQKGREYLSVWRYYSLLWEQTSGNGITKPKNKYKWYFDRYYSNVPPLILKS